VTINPPHEKRRVPAGRAKPQFEFVEFEL